MMMMMVITTATEIKLNRQYVKDSHLMLLRREKKCAHTILIRSYNINSKTIN